MSNSGWRPYTDAELHSALARGAREDEERHRAEMPRRVIVPEITFADHHRDERRETIRRLHEGRSLPFKE